MVSIQYVSFPLIKSAYQNQRQKLFTIAVMDVRSEISCKTNVPGDWNAVELGHEVGGVGKDVADDPHAVIGRVDVGVPHHELFQDVILK
jgi:hypothetical protein